MGLSMGMSIYHVSIYVSMGVSMYMSLYISSYSMYTPPRLAKNTKNTKAYIFHPTDNYATVILYVGTSTNRYFLILTAIFS